MSNQILLTSLIEEVNVGEVIDRKHWPLHVTLVPWLNIFDYTNFRRQLNDYLESSQILSIKVGPVENFGPKKDIPVNVLVPDERLTTLHGQLLKLCLNYGTLETAQYTGHNYRAHITHFDGKSLPEGNEVIINNIVIVGLLNKSACRVLEKYDL